MDVQLRTKLPQHIHLVIFWSRCAVQLYHTAKGGSPCSVSSQRIFLSLYRMRKWGLSVSQCTRGFHAVRLGWSVSVNVGPQDLGQLLRCVQSQQVSALKLLFQLTYIPKKDSTAIQDYSSQFQKVAIVSGLAMFTSRSRALQEVSPTYNWQARPR